MKNVACLEFPGGPVIRILLLKRKKKWKKNVACPISKQSMLQLSSRHIIATTTTSIMSPEGTQDGGRMPSIKQSAIASTPPFYTLVKVKIQVTKQPELFRFIIGLYKNSVNEIK